MGVGLTFAHIQHYVNNWIYLGCFHFLNPFTSITAKSMLGVSKKKEKKMYSEYNE